MTPAPRKSGFAVTWAGHFPALLLITAIVLLLEQSSCLAPFESLGIDRFVRVYPAPASRDIFLVEITDWDYKHWFLNKSPLGEKRLESLLTRIRKGGPKVIGVDLDTSDTAIPSLSDAPDLIWAEVPATISGGTGETARENPLFVLAPVLKNVTASKQMGMPQFPQDRDGLVRRFEDSFDVLNGRDKVRIPSLGCALARRLDPTVQCNPPGEQRRFSFSGDRFHFQTLDANAFLSAPADAPWLTANPFKDKIVLVGGRYRAARDTYITPAGELAGVEVIANAAQSYLRGGRSILEAPPFAAAIFDLLTGTFVIWLYWYWRERLTIAFWLSITVAPLLVMAASFLTFLTVGYWLGFVPVLLGMIIHELYDHAEHLHELRSPQHHPSARRFTLPSLRRARYPRRDRSAP